MVIVSLVAASGAFTMVNGVGINLSTAEFLIEEIREWSADKTFDELLAEDGTSHNPPVDISGLDMDEFSSFTQTITIEYVDADDLDSVVTGPTDFVRVTVTITKNSQPISEASWIRANL
jgi:hypothetical protein